MRTSLVFGAFLILVVSLIGFSNSDFLIQYAEARDFDVKMECLEEGKLQVTIVNAEEDKPLKDAKIMPLLSLGSGNVGNIFFTDINGVIVINFEDNLGYAWITKGGYNDKKIQIEKCSFYDVPDWIKNNAKWLIEGKIDEESFLKGIQFLIKNNIIEIPKTPDELIEPRAHDIDERIPSWIITNIEWWVDGKINDDTFVQGMQFLIIEGIIDIRESVQSSDDFATDSVLPSKETLAEFGITKPQWSITLGPYTGCENTVGVVSHRGLNAVVEEEYVEALSAHICKFDKLSNANRGWTGSTTSDEELMELSHYVGSSKLTGSCYVNSDYIFMHSVYGGCTYSNHIIGVSILSENNLNQEILLRIFVTLMDEMLTNVNSLKGGIEFDTSIANVLGIVQEYDTATGTQIGDLQTSGTGNESFDIQVVGCEPSGSGNYIEVSFGIKNNLNEDYTLDLQFLLLDKNGNVVGVERHYMDTKVGRTIYDSILMDYEFETTQCLIEIVDGQPSYP